MLVQKKIDRLQDAVNTLTKRKTYKRRYIRVEKTLIVSKVSNLIAKRESSSYKNSKTPIKRVRTKRRCGCYSKTRHNFRTYKVEIENLDNSDASKQYYSIAYSIIICYSVALRCYTYAALLLGS